MDFEENTCSTTSSVVMVDFDDLSSQGLLQFTDSGRACDYLHRCTTKSNNSDQCSSIPSISTKKDKAECLGKLL